MSYSPKLASVPTYDLGTKYTLALYSKTSFVLVLYLRLTHVGQQHNLYQTE